MNIISSGYCPGVLRAVLCGGSHTTYFSLSLKAGISRSCPGALWAVLYGWCPTMPLKVGFPRCCPGALWAVGALWLVPYYASECCDLSFCHGAL